MQSMANEFDREDEEAEKSVAAEVEAVLLEQRRQAVDKMIQRADRTKKLTDKLEADKRRKLRIIKNRQKHQIPFHADGVDEACTVCCLDAKFQEQLKYAYISGMSLKELKKTMPSKVFLVDVDRHSAAFKWNLEKMRHTETALTLIVEEGVKNIVFGDTKVEVSHLLEALKHIDKREGKIIDRVEHDTVVSVQFLGNTPAPGVARGAASEINTSKETKPLMLEPTSIEVLDEALPSDLNDGAVSANPVRRDTDHNEG